jgi:hypothetical protein
MTIDEIKRKFWSRFGSRIEVWKKGIKERSTTTSSLGQFVYQLKRAFVDPVQQLT